MTQSVPSFDIEQVTLNIEKFAATHNINIGEFEVELLEDPRFNEYVSQSLFIRISKFFAVSDTKDIDTKLPINVWEHFKQDYLPKWFKNKYPVKFTITRISCKEVFPQYNNLTHNRSRHLNVAVQRGLKILT